MPLTTAQNATLKADIQADPALNSQPNNSDGNAAIAAVYNANASPDFWVWKSAITKDELVGGTGPEGTTFAWTGAGYITRSQGERDAFNAIFDSQGRVNPSRANVRTAFSDIFSGGTAPAPANRTHMLAISRRKATRVEKLLATGTGSTASPALLNFEGTITGQDVEAARDS
jgi:hypothetical protein